MTSVIKMTTYTSLQFNNLEDVHYVLAYSSGKKINSYPIKKFLTRAFVQNKNQINLQAEILKRKKQLALIFVDKFGHESEPKIIHLKQTN